MALQDTDLLLVNRGGTNYRVTLAEFKEATAVGNVLSGTATLGPSSVTSVPHTSVDVARSYVILSGGAGWGGAYPGPGLVAGAASTTWLASRTATSFSIGSNPPSATFGQGGTTSWQLIY